MKLFFKHILVTLTYFALHLMATTSIAQGSANGVFTGQVFDVAEQPVAGVEIFVYSGPNTRKPADFISPPTNAEGQYQVTLPPGEYWAVARLRHGRERFGPLSPGDKHSGAPLQFEIAPDEEVQEDFIIADLEETSRLTVKSDTSYIKIQGHLLTKEGQPVANRYAYANRTPARKKIPDFVSAWTGESGRYTLYLEPGTYYFAATAAFPPGDESVDFQKVMIDSDPKNINIVIDK